MKQQATNQPISTRMNQHHQPPPTKAQLTHAFVSEIISLSKNKYQIPAIAVSIMDSDSIYLQEAQGARVYNKPEPVTLNDFFHIGSCAKSVLAVIASKLVEQMKISWQTRFFDVFTDLENDANQEYGQITLEDLFLCQAGIKAYTHAATEPFPDYPPSVTDRRLRFIKELIAQPPSAKKKADKFQHLYSNASYTLACAMLERVSGKTYQVLVNKTLAEDLGLSVYIGWPNTINPNQPWGHQISKHEIESFPPEHDYKLPDLITAAGDLSMPAKDYAKYTQFHLRGLRGKEDYISNDAFNYIHFAHNGFSLGVGNGKLAGKKLSGFDGSAGTFFCRSVIVPEADFALTIMANAFPSSGSTKAIDSLTLKIIKKHFHWWWKFWL